MTPAKLQSFREKTDTCAFPRNPRKHHVRLLPGVKMRENTIFNIFLFTGRKLPLEERKGAQIPQMRHHWSRGRKKKTDSLSVYRLTLAASRVITRAIFAPDSRLSGHRAQRYIARSTLVGRAIAISVATLHL